MLERVYNEFDLDGGGDVGADEIFELGKARRALGQRSGEWTEAHNERMLEKMGADPEGNVSMEKFVKYFNQLLPQDDDEFGKNIHQFSQCAHSLDPQPVASQVPALPRILAPASEFLSMRPGDYIAPRTWRAQECHQVGDSTVFHPRARRGAATARATYEKRSMPGSNILTLGAF